MILRPPISTLFPYTDALPISADTWKAGVAKANITPETYMWMAGYAARTKPAESKDRKSTRLNSSHSQISYAVFCLKKKKKKIIYIIITHHIILIYTTTHYIYH